MCVCKRSRTTRSSIRMGWDHMVSEASAERFVFRARAGPLCPAESSKMQLCGQRKKEEKLIGTVSVRVFDVCATKLHISLEPCVRRHRFCMTTKSPTLNISAFVPSSVWVFEKPGQTRFPCVFVAQLRCAHTLRKSFVMHLFERFTVWCSLLVLKMSSSARSPGLPLLVSFLFLTLLAHSPLGV